MIKQFLMDYCEAIHPDNTEAQDDLFRKIVGGEVNTPPVAEMSRIVDSFRMRNLGTTEQVSSSLQGEIASAETLRDEAIARAERQSRDEERERLYSRLYNYKFESAVQYLDGAQLRKRDRALVKYLAARLVNSGWIMGDFSLLIDAALSSIKGYKAYLKSNKGS